jgi:hypothetical protein
MINLITLAIIIMLVGMVVFLILSFPISGYSDSEKNVTITVVEKELTYCFMDDVDKLEITCNRVDMNKRQFTEIDDYLQAYIDERIERSYKIMK